VAVFAVAGDSETAVLVLQVLLSVATAWLAFVIAGALWGQLAGISAALVNALDVTQFTSSGVILTETLGALALLVFVGIGYRVASRRPPLARWGRSWGSRWLSRPSSVLRRTTWSCWSLCCS
jgi:hypothetical protein